MRAASRGEGRHLPSLRHVDRRVGVTTARPQLSLMTLGSLRSKRGRWRDHTSQDPDHAVGLAEHVNFAVAAHREPYIRAATAVRDVVGIRFRRYEILAAPAAGRVGRA